MQYIYQDNQINEFLDRNKQDFEDELLSQAETVKSKIDEIMEIGNIDLINNAHRLVYYVLEGKEEELKAFAKQEGIIWATHSLTLSFKLEWVQAIRRTLWIFIERYIEEKEITIEFFSVEKHVNNYIDLFLNAFFINYSTYKDSLLTAQRKLVENLSVPIIPITPTTCILPIIGAMDYFRAKIMEEKVLMEISRLHIQTMLMDLSGIAEMETQVIDQLISIMEGAELMGCKTIITGLRPDVVRNMMRLGVKFNPHTKTFGTLQQALSVHVIK
ncbi:STAS domain-containing protein [Sporosarcina sp. Sa2YVA2]|uniref:STAS domain-containing protein n=1 Tax=Sporosarcina quadrami TaxID=2762234 RepID=A0ABR8UCW7_9BACL|nr:STAS domain-containing protein [Sporosarcina quadrami]MBD7985856.1 STAS domain-containing protein [Sporosarcina quadrami]